MSKSSRKRRAGHSGLNSDIGFNNPVAKNLPKVHRPSTHIDKKKELKKTGVYNDIH